MFVTLAPNGCDFVIFALVWTNMGLDIYEGAHALNPLLGHCGRSGLTENSGYRKEKSSEMTPEFWYPTIANRVHVIPNSPKYNTLAKNYKIISLYLRALVHWAAVRACLRNASKSVFF